MPAPATPSDAARSGAARLAALAAAFLKLGAVSYGGAGIMGIIHADMVEKRRWLSDARYLEGMGLVYMLPGPPAVQLAVFIGYDRGGWTGGVVAGLAFMLPAFFILMGLTLLYSTYGEIGVIRDALYGIGAVVIGIFAAAVYKLGRPALEGGTAIAIAACAAILLAATPVGVATILLLAACAGVARYHSRTHGLVAALTIAGLAALLFVVQPLVLGESAAAAGAGAGPPSLLDLAGFFLKVSAFGFGGGMSIIAFVQDHVVNRAQWLTPREFLDGLALGQLTPGPVLMISAYIGYKLAGIVGALVSAACIFAPAFFLVLPLMPVLERFGELAWIKAAIRGITPAIIGCLAVTLARLAPHAAPDVPAAIVMVLGALVLIRWRISPLPLIAAAGMLGILVRAH